MDNESTKARLERVREAARTLITERDWFREQADMIDAALKALGISVQDANAKGGAIRRPAPVKNALLTPGKRTAYLGGTEYRTNLEIAEDVLTQYGGPMDIRQLQTEMRKRGRGLGYSSIASLCSKGAAVGRLRRVGVGIYRVTCEDHELTSHLGELPTHEMGHPREANAILAPVPAHLLTEQPSRERLNYMTHDPVTGQREYATDYHEDDEHEGEGE